MSKHQRRAQEAAAEGQSLPKSNYELVAKELASTPSSQRDRPNVDLSQAGLATLVLVNELSSPKYRERFDRQVAVKEVEADLLARAAMLAYAAIHVRREQLAEQALSSDRVVSEATASGAAQVRERMLRVLEYHLGEHPTVGPRIAFLRTGTGLLDTANDLDESATLYVAHHDVVSADRTWFRTTDVADSRKYAGEIYLALAPRSTGSVNWNEQASALWPRLLHDYEQLRRVLVYFHWDDGGLERYVSIVTASREAASVKKKESTEPTG